MRKLLSLITALALILSLTVPSAFAADVTMANYSSTAGVCMLSWSNVGALSYTVNVYNASTNTVVYSGTSTYNYLYARTLGLTSGTTYYYTVVAEGSSTPATSSTFTYDSSLETTSVVITGATYDYYNDLLMWTSVGAIEQFKVEIYSADDNSLLRTFYTTNNYISGDEAFKDTGNYYYKVRIVDANGNNVGDSNYWYYCPSDSTYGFSATVTVTFDAGAGYFNGDETLKQITLKVDRNTCKVEAFPFDNVFLYGEVINGYYTELNRQIYEDQEFYEDTILYAHYDDCDHTTSTTKASCEDVTCSVCGMTISGNGHSYESMTINPTCTEDGYTTYTCTVCNDIYTETIPATGHNYDEGFVTKEATCTEDGEITYTCSNCSGTYTETISATGHNYDNGVVTKEATCTEDGVKTYTCSVCQDTYTETIPATGHSYDDGVVTTEATCTEDGVKTYTCTKCSETYTEAIAATGHTESDEVVVENEVAATCTEDGSYDNVVYCTVCNEELSRVTVTTLATGHSYVDGVCENCGELGASESTTTDSTNTQTSTVVVSDTVNSVLKPNTLDGATVNQATISITSTETGTLTVTEIKDNVTASGTLTFSDSSSSYTFASTEGEITGGTVLTGVETNSSGAVIENTGTVLFYGDIDFETSSNNATASTLTITLDVSGTLSSNGNITADNIKLLHYENGGWVTVDGNIEISPSGLVTITAETDSYSPFAVILVSEVKKSTYTSQAEALALLMRIQALAANTNTTSGTTDEAEETAVDLTEEIVEIEEPVEAGETDLE